MDFENDQYRMPAMVKVADEYETHGGELKIFLHIQGSPHSIGYNHYSVGTKTILAEGLTHVSK